jgi:protein gp37
MSKTGIPYLDEVLNVTSGCTKISEGCANCYASRLSERFHGGPFDGSVVLHPERLEEALHWRTPRRVGVCFTSDLFHDRVPDEFIDKVFAVMALTPQHTYMLLTKRPERMRALMSSKNFVGRVYTRAWDVSYSGPYPRDELPAWPLSNVFLGVSCENQARADERIPLLLETPAAHRWVSLEPLLGAVDLTPFTGAYLRALGKGLDWVVVGGESGPHARPCDLGWIRDIRDQCKAAGVPCYVEQLGSAWVKSLAKDLEASGLRAAVADKLAALVDFKGEDRAFWPADLRVREMPEGWA